ncbi:MAG: cytochrome b N-terminal domain-containing protein [Deferribacterota bacterium]|nr:cytochrome b N-terminal domain-containing protein [Deferribacterota bacterium]
MFSEFLKHIFPKIILKNNLKISYTFCLGGLSLLAFFILCISGILLSIYYEPTPERAYNSILFIEENILLGKYLRDMHRFSNHLFLVLLFLHTLRVILTGVYRLRSYNWIIGMILLVLSLFEAYSGYLLPMDQLSLWATQTGMNLLESIPFGKGIKDLLVVHNIQTNYTLLRFYILHIIIVPIIMLIFISIHFYRIRKDKGVLPYI